MTTEYYQLTPPGGAKPFTARVEYEPNIVVYTNKTGKWQPDPTLHLADILMPEQGPLYEWDIREVKQGGNNR